MFGNRFGWLLAIVAIGWSPLHAQNDPVLNGYVTDAGTPQAFDLNGVHVICQAAQPGPGGGAPAANGACAQHSYGQHLLVYGHREKSSGVVVASKVETEERYAGKAVNGIAVVDGLLAPGVVRADGRAIRVSSSTHIENEPPLTSAAPPEVGLWVEYAGKYGSDGIVAADFISFFRPEVTKSEQKLRSKTEFDPAAVSEQDRQSGAGRFFRGRDPKRIPAAKNDALQQRVEELGQRLVPASQKQLPAGDPNRVNFRFQLVESKDRDALDLASGIILVPEPVARLLNDDELAAVLADNMAAVLEDQASRTLAANHAMQATELAGTAAGLLVPGLGLATGLGNGIAGKKLQTREEEQSGRMALVLMHDAGFDIEQAPLAWWKLSSHHADFMADHVPGRAAYLFNMLNLEWMPGSPLLAAPAAAR